MVTIHHHNSNIDLFCEANIATTLRFMLSQSFGFLSPYIYTLNKACYTSIFCQSMESFFRDRSYTLGNLIGISSFLELSRRSNRTRNDQSAARNHQHQKNLKTYYKPWIFSICSKLSTNATVISHNRIINEDNDGRNNVQSLGHFLMVERRAVGSTIRSTPTMWMSKN